MLLSRVVLVLSLIRRVVICLNIMLLNYYDGFMLSAKLRACGIALSGLCTMFST